MPPQGVLLLQRMDFVQISSDIFRLSSEFVRKCDQTPETSDSCVSSNLLVNQASLNSPVSSVREAAYRRYYFPSPGQEDLLKSLLGQRRQLARTVGFPTYAHRALRGSLLETPANAEAFLISITEKLKVRSYLLSPNHVYFVSGLE